MVENQPQKDSKMIKRNIADSILAALSDTPVVLLNGARQTGKSTLVKWLAEKKHKAEYITFDDATTLSAARNDPSGFLAGINGPVVLDEIQKAPDLFPALKVEVDRDRTPGRFLLTGSANVLLLPKISESLTGRMEILTLYPFSQGELASKKETFLKHVFDPSHFESKLMPLKNRELLRRIKTGGFPEVVTRHSFERKAAWCASYITTILQRDIRDIADIDRLTEMPKLLALLAARAASMLNFAEISRSIGIPVATLKRYVAIFEATFLVHFLKPWSANLGKRLAKAPKIILSDTGLLTHLLGLSAEDSVPEPMIAGRLLENFVVMELFKQRSWSRTKPGIFYFRTHDGYETDVVLEDSSGKIVGIEVKSSHTVKSEDFKTLKFISEDIGSKFIKGIVLYQGDKTIPFAKNLFAMPIQALWA
jgi:uncharacterized protein